MITITAKAIEKIKEISESEGINHTSIRLKVIGGGCAGFQYDMFFDDQFTDLDETLDQDGVKVIVDPLSMQYLEGVEVDYQEGLISSGFRFNNPNVTKNCGCGSSFGV